MADDISQVFKTRIDKYMKENRLQKQDMARLLGLTTGTFYRYRAGLRKVPKSIWLLVEYVTKGAVKFNL